MFITWVRGRVFCNQKARAVFLWIFSSLSFFLFSLLRQDLDTYVSSSIVVPLFLYFTLVYARNWRQQFKHGNVKEEIDSTLTDLAKKENPKIESVVVREMRGKRAFTQKKKKIVLSSALSRNGFSDQEIRAVLHHEIYHTKSKDYDLLVSGVLLVVLFILIRTMFDSANSSLIFLFFLIGGFSCSLWVVAYERLRWQSEFNADTAALVKSDTDVLISALRRSSVSYNMNCDTPMHPSINRRIAKIRKAFIANRE